MIRIPPPAVDAAGPGIEIPSGAALLGRLLGDMPIQAFLDGHYLRAPLARPGTAAAWTVLVDDPLIDGLLRTAGCDVVVARQGRILAMERPGTLEDERRLAGAGCSCLIRHAERWSPAIARYAEALAEVIPGTIDAHICRTPASATGFGWHCDPEEVFILQTAGRKRYFLRENTVHPAPLAESMPRPGLFARETSAVLACDLAAGDWLYIPGGWWHMATALDASTSLCLGIRAWARIDALRALAGDLAATAGWRRRALLSASDSAIALHQAALADLAATIAELARDPAAIAAWLRRDGTRAHPPMAASAAGP